MIVVKNGFTMSEHAPITYNYRYQSTPSPVSRTNIFPLVQNDPPAAITDTGVLVYLTSSALPSGTLVGSTEIEFYMAWNSSVGANKLAKVKNDFYNGKYHVIEIAPDGYNVEWLSAFDTPVIFALSAPSISMPLATSSHAWEYNTDSGGNDAVTLAYQYVEDGVTYTGKKFFFENYRRYNRVRLAAGSHTQQEQVYTVTGGIVIP